MIDQGSVDLLALLGRPSAKLSARTNGGEYHLPCPFCGGRDRFVAMPNQEPPRAWCRQCGWSGDSIQLVRDMDNLSVGEAKARLGLVNAPYAPRAVDSSAQAYPSTLNAVKRKSNRFPDGDSTPERPSASWSGRMTAFVDWAQSNLRGNESKLDYLRERGLSDFIIEEAGLGWNPTARIETVDGKRVRYHAGIVIPHLHKGAIEAVKVRLESPYKGNRYLNIKGSRPGLYRRDKIAGSDRMVIVTETELDALAVQAYDPCADLWTGRHEWISVAAPANHGQRYASYLVGRFLVALAMDNDAAGIEATAKWVDIFPSARVLALPDGCADIGDWIAASPLEALEALEAL